MLTGENIYFVIRISVQHYFQHLTVMRKNQISKCFVWEMEKDEPTADLVLNGLKKVRLCMLFHFVALCRNIIEQYFFIFDSMLFFLEYFILFGNIATYENYFTYYIFCYVIHYTTISGIFKRIIFLSPKEPLQISPKQILGDDREPHSSW